MTMCWEGGGRLNPPSKELEEDGEHEELPTIDNAGPLDDDRRTRDSLRDSFSILFILGHFSLDFLVEG